MTSPKKQTRPLPHPVISGRVDPAIVEIATDRLKISRAELVKRAIIEFVSRLIAS